MNHLCEFLGHADRRAGFIDYSRGLMLPIERKSVEPQTVPRKAPLRRSADILLAISLAAWGGVGMAAAAPPGLLDSMRACAQEQNDARRLGCYDRAMAGSEKSFGLTPKQQRTTEKSDGRVAATQPAISSRIVSVTLRSDGRNVIALESGQTWIQGDAFEHTAIHAGDEVTIKPGLLGSFYMYLPSQLRTRVTREK